MKKKILMLHFSPLEMFPPAMNWIKFLHAEAGEHFEIVVITSQPPTGYKMFECGSVRIIRTAKHVGSVSRFRRAWALAGFNVLGILKLFTFHAHVVFYFETNSSLPAIIGKKLLKMKFRLFIHYHEYMSWHDYAKTRFQRMLHEQEIKLYRKAEWVSHTNQERLELFMKDASIDKGDNFFVIRNLPSKVWAKRARMVKRPKEGDFVFVGTLTLELFYIREFIEWLYTFGGGSTLTVYTQSDTTLLIEFLKKFDHQKVFIKGYVPYDCLPDELMKFETGVILYKGIGENVIYSAPNKLFEYLSCGLNVIVDKSILGARPYYNSVGTPFVIGVEFNSLDEMDLKKVSSTEGKAEFKFNDCYEIEYTHLLNRILLSQK